MPAVTVRPYRHAVDFERIARLLVEAYEPVDRPRTWLEARWEYMHFHTLIVGQPIERFGVAEEGGRILGIVHFEADPAVAYVQVRPGCERAIEPLLAWAEAHLGGPSGPLGEESLGIYVPDGDPALWAAVARRGFVEVRGVAEASSVLTLAGPPPPARLPAGIRLQSLEDDNDLARINRVLWRGFDHGDDAPDDEIAGRALAQQAPGFRRDLTIVAVEPSGEYVAFCGMWFMAENAAAYVEPVATDPAFRRRGIGRAAVLESLRRVAALGARVAWVGSDLPFYRDMGFVTTTRSVLWARPRQGGSPEAERDAGG